MSITRPKGRAAQDVPPAVAAWDADVAGRLQEQAAVGSDREAQMDARRRAGALEHARQVVHELLQERPARVASGSVRAVVVHRSDWLRARLAEGLEERGVEVVGQGEDGAAALAAALVEQPEVLVLEGLLPWVTPADVVQDVRRYAPRTYVVVLVEGHELAGQMLDAGAHAVYSRAVPPADVVDAVLTALRDAAGHAPRVSA